MKQVKLLVGVLLVLVMLESVMSPAMARTSDMVNQSEAKAVVEKFIARISIVSNFKDWRNAKIGKVIVAYDAWKCNRDSDSNNDSIRHYRQRYTGSKH